MTTPVNISCCTAITLLWLGACGGAGDGGGPISGPDAGPGDPGGSPGENGGSPDAAPVSCGAPPPLPVSVSETLTGFSGSEDFAFDAEGNLVSTDSAGNLTRQPRGGDARLVVPNLGETAGTRFLGDGDLVIAVVDTGSLVRISPAGSQQTILGGLAYPNGVEVGRDGLVYVAEHDAGRVRRVNPTTGEFTIIGEGMETPNGISFGPDYRTLYVGSFGAGIVYSLTMDDSGGWGPVEELGRTPASLDSPSGGLDGLTVDACGFVYVTEYIQGKIWRFAPSGGPPELVVTLDSEWIPNMHWGVGIGGWDPGRLYVMDRDHGRLFELPVGNPEKARVYP